MAGFLSILWKWGPTLGLILISGYAGYQYKTYLVNSAEAKQKISNAEHYTSSHEKYIDKTNSIQLQYEIELDKIKNDKTPECNAIAPDCLRNAF